MKVKEIIAAKDAALVAVPNQFNENVVKAQRQLYSVVLRLLDELEYENGVLLPTEANYARISLIIEQMGVALSRGEYADAVVSLAQSINEQAALTRLYFAETFGEAFSDQTLYQNALIQSQRNALLSLTSEGIDANFLEPFRTYLTQSITASTSRADLQLAVEQYINGTPEKLGRLRSYSGQIADDIFSVIDRGYTQIIANDLQIQWYFYSGSVIQDSRDFCVTRHNKYYHKKEVESWGSLGDWQGKIPGTNASTIFSFAGGYRCRHSILPVSVEVVPQNVIERAKAKGYIN